MKLLLVVDGLWGGGTERSMAEMLPQLVEEGISPMIVCLRRRYAEGVEIEVLQRGFDVRFLSGSSFASRVVNLRRIIEKERPKIIHSALFQANIVSRFAAAGTGIPVLSSLVNTPYDAIRYEDPDVRPLLLRAVQQIDGWTSRHLTTHFHAVSVAAKRSGVQTLGIREERITVVQRGRDESRFRPPSDELRSRIRKEMGLVPENFLLVNVGRHDYQKGQAYLIQALSLLKPRCSQSVLFIAGRHGRCTDRLQELCESLELQCHVRFLGHCNNIPEVLAAADLFVFPSLFEGLPGAVIEAMAMALPIVATDIAATREVVEENCNALLVKPACPEAFAGAIAELMKNPEQRRAYARRSREIFEDRFTLNRSVQRMVQLYRRVADHLT